MPGHYTNSNGNIALMNTMYNMSQFFVVVHVPNETYITLADDLVQRVLTIFGICYLVVLDDGTPFKELFIAMCQSLNLNDNVPAKHNHKGLSVEHFHRF